MSIGIRTFGNFKEANLYAKAINASVGKSPLLRPTSLGFEVQGEGVTPSEVSTTIDVNAVLDELREIRKSLNTSTSENELKSLIEIFLKKFGTSIELQEKTENSELLENLEDVHLALEEFSELIEESVNPRSKEEAEYFANRFLQISEQLTPYPVSKRAQKEYRELIQKSAKLPVVDTSNQQWLQKISILNASGPICRYCTNLARMHIVGNRGSEIWRCYANNHGTRFLTREQRKFLE